MKFETMEAPVKNLEVLLKKMNPVLKPGIWAFVSVPHGTSLEGSLEVLGTFKYCCHCFIV